MEDVAGAMRPVVMPSVEVGMEEGLVVELLVEIGDTVKEGQALFIVEAEKVTLEIESPSSGLVVEICVASGSVVAVGAPVLLLGAG